MDFKTWRTPNCSNWPLQSHWSGFAAQHAAWTIVKYPISSYKKIKSRMQLGYFQQSQCERRIYSVYTERWACSWYRSNCWEKAEQEQTVRTDIQGDNAFIRRYKLFSAIPRTHRLLCFPAVSAVSKSAKACRTQWPAAQNFSTHLIDYFLSTFGV